MKRKTIFSSFVAVCVLLSSLYAFASPTPGYEGPSGISPGSIKLKNYSIPGTVLTFDETDGKGIANGTRIYWEHPDPDYVHYIYGTAVFPDGSKSRLLQYGVDTEVRNNGYLLLAEQDIETWASSLGGNVEYVKKNLNGQIYGDPTNYYSTMKTLSFTTWRVVPLPQVINASGGTIDFLRTSADNSLVVNPDGWTVSPTYKVTPTPAPTSTLTLDKETYAGGEKVKATLTSSIYAANTTWHDVAVHIKGYGVDKYLPITGKDKNGAAVTYPAATGTDYFGQVRPIWGGGSGDPSQPKTYTETVEFDTTGLSSGTYTLEYILYDHVGRVSQNGTLSKSFQVTGGAGVMLDASPIIAEVGGTCTLTATVNNAPEGYQVIIRDVDRKQTLNGSNIRYGLTATATSDQEQTVSYSADLLDQNGLQLGVSNTIDCVWMNTPTVPTLPTLTLTADKADLIAGERSKLTLTYDQLIEGDILRIYDDRGNPVGSNTLITNGITAPVSSQEPAVRFYQGVMLDPKTFEEHATSNFVTVVWNKGNQPPVAVIDAQTPIKAGQEVPILAYQSYDEDGYIRGYSWSYDPQDTVHAEYHSEYELVWFEQPGVYTVHLTVTDNEFATDSTQTDIVVTEARPTAVIHTLGKLKENRKVTLDASYSSAPTHYPIDWTKTTWSIRAVSGGTDADIKYSSVLDGNQLKDVLFKKAGDYEVTLSVTNTLGFTDTTTKIITIVPDLKPNAVFQVTQQVLRDPSNPDVNGKSQATILLNDLSVSPDYDPIVKREWYVQYDSHNILKTEADRQDPVKIEQAFANEPWVLIDDTNKTYLTYRTSDVGQYRFGLVVHEGFGEPTLPEFVTASDYRVDRSWDSSP